MVQLFVDGGGFMWPILFIFIIGFVFVGERLYHLIKGLASTEEFAMDIANTLEKNGVKAAQSLCEESVGPVANLCGTALEKADQGVEAVEKTLDQAGAIEMASMEKNMTWISLCIATAPMLGFLGTVWGMIQAFNDIKMANDISPAVVAGGISVALLTTAFGLVVAVILQILQNAVMYIIDNQIVTLQKSTTMLINSMEKKK
jgi:biopolymer transport protein ExbB